MSVPGTALGSLLLPEAGSQVPREPSMNNLSAFARHFAQLVWLLVHRREEQDQQKEALRLALGELTSGKQALVLSDITFQIANTFHDTRLGEMFVWMSELSVRMSAHSVRALEFETSASAHDVLEIARALTTPPVPGDEGEAFDEKVVAFSPKGIAVHIGSLGFVRRATPAIHGTSVVGPARTPALGNQVIASRLKTPSPGNGAGMMVVDAEPNPPANGMDGPHARDDIADETMHILESEFAPGLTPAPRLKDLLHRLDTAPDSLTAAKIIDDVAREAEERAREGLWVDLALVLDRLSSRADQLRDGDLKRAYQFAIRRLEKPALMRGIGQLLPRRRELRQVATRLLAHAGEAGADALIDLLVSAESTTERYAYRTALAQCPAAVPALVHLLGDSRWYVVRNAVELLGEVSPADADARLAVVLGHGEPRVRRAVATSLAKLGTPRAVLALLQAVQDPSPEVRLQVALGLGTTRNPRAVPWLIEALDKEQDAEVQAAMLSALGKLATEEAVARLARAAEPGGMLLRRSTAMRLNAVDALLEAGTPSAHAVLRSLMNDRDRDVREAAQRLVNPKG